MNNIYKLSFSFCKTVFAVTLFCYSLFSPGKIIAEDDKHATIRLVFDPLDSTKTLKAILEEDGLPLKKVELHFYVKSLFGLLPVGDVVETDSSGEADAVYPKNLPGDKNGIFTAVVKMEDNDTYGNVKAEVDIKWGVGHTELNNWNKRSLSASREKAPAYLIISSVLIIAVVWGTIFYIIFQLFKIKKVSAILRKV